MGRFPRHLSPRALLAAFLPLCGGALFACSPGQDSNPPITVVRPGEAAPPDLTDEQPPTLGEATESDLRLIEAPPPPSCGDGALNDDEQCDDSNKSAGDGCSANCLVVEQGYACPTPGAECVQAAVCGDGLEIGSEQCDDRNAVGDDGCTATCQLERDFACPTPGEPCVSSVTCGDRRVSGDEQCDDGNALDGDGCSAACTSELGFACPIVGALCVAVCGDGLLRGAERCDDDNATSGDGCSATCGNEDGFACGAVGQLCFRTTCGDEVQEGSEGCDDGAADRPFDGCFQCVREPACTLGECAAVCGDGLRYTDEECDDGNANDGDGCSATCQRELGFDCQDRGGTGGAGDTFILPVVYRDFVGVDTSGDGQEGARVTARATAGITLHPDFNTFQGTGVLGAVQNELGANGLPVFACAGNGAAAGCDANFTSAQRFDEWYEDTPGVNRPVVEELTLTPFGDGAFQFDSANLAATDNGQFDPLLDKGFQAQVVGGVPVEGHEFCDVAEVPTTDGPGGTGTERNMSFTTETRFVFEYVGGENFEFSGDDDVWVFINNRLVMDLGGLHQRATGSFTLDDDGVATIEREGPEGSLLTLDAPLRIDTGMRLNQVYEAVLFHAERHECGSNFKLTLAGFDKPRSVCEEVCGDGFVTRSESCDDGPLNGTGYGVCAADCTPGPRCGDGVVNGGDEVCDDGLNVARYLRTSGECGLGCTLPSRCGDGVVDAAFGELCDDSKNDNSYGGCSDSCKLGPRCGDGDPNGDEECDDGNRVNGDNCNLSCRNERLPA